MKNQGAIRMFFANKAKNEKDLNNILKAVRGHFSILDFEEAGQNIPMHFFMHKCMYCVSLVPCFLLG